MSYEPDLRLRYLCVNFFKSVFFFYFYCFNWILLIIYYISWIRADDQSKDARPSYFNKPALDVSIAFPQATPASIFPPAGIIDNVYINSDLVKWLLYASLYSTNLMSQVSDDHKLLKWSAMFCPLPLDFALKLQFLTTTTSTIFWLWRNNPWEGKSESAWRKKWLQ